MLATQLEYQKDLVEVEKLLREAIAVTKNSLGESHIELAEIYSRLGKLLKDQPKRNQEAEELFEKAIAIHETNIYAASPDEGLSYSNLEEFLTSTNDRLQAKEAFEHPISANMYIGLGQLLIKVDRLEEAEQCLRRAVQIDEITQLPNSPDLGESYSALAGFLKSQGRLDEAEKLYQKALAIFEESLGPDNIITQIAKARLEPS